MKFVPMTEEELARASLLEAGVYPFEVLSAQDKISKTGNEMIELKLNVFGNNGENVHVFDYLLEKMSFKLRHFCEATGLLSLYERGELEAIVCPEKQGFCKIAVDKGNANYAAKNVVQDYLKPETTAKPIPLTIAPDIPRKLTPQEFAAKHGIDLNAKLDEDIPF